MEVSSLSALASPRCSLYSAPWHSKRVKRHDGTPTQSLNLKLGKLLVRAQAGSPSHCKCSAHLAWTAALCVPTPPDAGGGTRERHAPSMRLRFKRCSFSDIGCKLCCAMRRAPPAGGPAGSRAASCRLAPELSTCGRAHPRNPAVSCAAAASDAAASAAAAHAAAAAASAGRDVRREAAVLGGEDFILSQRSGVSEDLFKGEVLGADADVAGVAFRQTLLKDLSSLPEGLHPPPRFLEVRGGTWLQGRYSQGRQSRRPTAALGLAAFAALAAPLQQPGSNLAMLGQAGLAFACFLDLTIRPPPLLRSLMPQRVAVHFARSLLAARGDLPGPVPLILGIWGPKVGCGAQRGDVHCWRQQAAQPAQRLHARPACALAQAAATLSNCPLPPLPFPPTPFAAPSPLATCLATGRGKDLLPGALPARHGRAARLPVGRRAGG